MASSTRVCDAEQEAFEMAWGEELIREGREIMASEAVQRAEQDAYEELFGQAVREEAARLDALAAEVEGVELDFS